MFTIRTQAIFFTCSLTRKPFIQLYISWVFHLPEETVALLLVTSLALTTFLATFLSSTTVIQVVIIVVMIMGTDHLSSHNLLIFINYNAGLSPIFSASTPSKYFQLPLAITSSNTTFITFRNGRCRNRGTVFMTAAR